MHKKYAQNWWDMKIWEVPPQKKTKKKDTFKLRSFAHEVKIAIYLSKLLIVGVVFYQTLPYSPET